MRGGDDTRESMSSEVMRISESEGSASFISDGDTTGSSLSTSGSEFEVQTAISTRISKSPILAYRHESTQRLNYPETSTVPISPRRLSPTSTASWLAHDSPHVDSSPDMKKLSLGPKVRLFGKAPWDTEDGEEEEQMSTSVSNVTLQASPSGGAVSRGSRGDSISSLASGPKGKENIRTANRSPISSGPASPQPRRFGSLERDEVLKGLGFGSTASIAGSDGASIARSRSEIGPLDEPIRPFPSHSSNIDFRRPSQPSLYPLPPLSASSSFANTRVPPSHESTSNRSPPKSPQLEIPKSAPPHFSHFSSAETSPPTPPTKNGRPPPASVSIRSGRSLPSSPSLPPSPFEGDPNSPGKAAAGRRFVSLEEATQRETERIAKNRLPVGYTKEKSSMPSATVKELISAESRSIRSIKSIKQKNSGFLKRMMGGDRERTGNSPPLPMEPYAPPVESFRSLPDDYVHVPLPRPPTPSTISPSPTSTLPVEYTRDKAGPHANESKDTPEYTRTNFFPPPPPVPESRPRKGLPPSLSLRPVSMAFSAGLPANFLEQQSAKAALLATANLPYQATPPTRPAPAIPLPSPYAASFKSTGTSSIFDVDIPASATSSSFATPASAVFSPLSSPTDIDVESPTTALRIGSFERKTSLSADTVGTGFTSMVAMQEQFGKARRVWRGQQFDLESQIKVLTLEVARLSAGTSTGSSIDGAALSVRCPLLVAQACRTDAILADSLLSMRVRFVAQSVRTDYSDHRRQRRIDSGTIQRARWIGSAIWEIVIGCEEVYFVISLLWGGLLIYAIIRFVLLSLEYIIICYSKFVLLSERSTLAPSLPSLVALSLSAPPPRPSVA